MLYAFVEAAVGAIAEVVPCTRGTTSRVWCVETTNGRFAVKLHGRGRAFAQERAALTRLPADDAWPRLVANDPEQLALVMTWLAGTPASASHLDAATRTKAFANAGALRQRFDAIAIVEDDPLPLAEALDARMTHALASIDPDVAAQVRVRWNPRVFAGATRRFCHRDFAPHNWLVGDDASLRCIDFGHARADHPLVDLARALSPVWGDPKARASLLAGYARELDDGERAQLRQLELLDAVATAAWGRRRDDAALDAGGHAAIAAWLAVER
jgi:hypothetical protein